MTATRRGLFGWLAAALVVPAAAKTGPLVLGIDPAVPWDPVVYAWSKQAVYYADLAGDIRVWPGIEPEIADVLSRSYERLSKAMIERNARLAAMKRNSDGHG